MTINCVGMDRGSIEESIYQGSWPRANTTKNQLVWIIFGLFCWYWEVYLLASVIIVYIPSFTKKVSWKLSILHLGVLFWVQKIWRYDRFEGWRKECLNLNERGKKYITTLLSLILPNFCISRIIVPSYRYLQYL